MIRTSKWTFIIFMILCFDRSRTMNPLLDPTHAMFATEREWVRHFAAFDPCSRGGLWLAINDAARTRATDDCEQAHDYFLLLMDEEKVSCPEARDPKCISGFGCTSLEYKCTFECNIVVEGWHRQNSGARRLERGPVRKWMRKDLRSIAATVVEPRIIPEGSSPQAYSNRGHRRLDAKTPLQHIQDLLGD